MYKNKLISTILIFVIMFSTLFSFSVSMAGEVTFNGEVVTVDTIKENMQSLMTKNPFEMALSDIVVSFGDFILDYVVFLFKDEITIDRLVFNKIPSLDANFFEASQKGIVPNATKIICGVVNNWYAFFRALSILTYMIVLIFVGIKILIRNTELKGKS